MASMPDLQRAFPCRWFGILELWIERTGYLIKCIADKLKSTVKTAWTQSSLVSWYVTIICFFFVVTGQQSSGMSSEGMHDILKEACYHFPDHLARWMKDWRPGYRASPSNPLLPLSTDNSFILWKFSLVKGRGPFCREKWALFVHKKYVYLALYNEVCWVICNWFNN